MIHNGTQLGFLVISYDNDQQKLHFDFVGAPSAQAAVQLVCIERASVVAADALSAEAVCRLAEIVQLRNRPEN
jgi:hypothetical protein